ncbi:hypothetical protein MKY04_18165 [Lysinibacillus telephonicus]|uniref:hypothetical protein n=1 Tax=Lysinibacillus telephonicus TaxID=1714840 RepID=UPI0031FC24CA
MSSVEQFHFLEDQIQQLDITELLRVASQPYSDSNWVHLVYSAVCSTLHSDIGEFYDSRFNQTNSEELNKHIKVVKCCFSPTSFKSRGIVIDSKEFRFLFRDRFLEGIGVYTVFLEKDCYEITKSLTIKRIIEHSIIANPCNKIFLALVPPSQQNWELVHIELKKPTIYPSHLPHFLKAKAQIFNNPQRLIQSIISGRKITSIDHIEFTTRIAL